MVLLVHSVDVKEQLGHPYVHLLNPWDVIQHQWVFSARFEHERAAAKQSIDKRTFVGNVRDSAERNIVTAFIENAGSGDDASVSDRVGAREPLDPRYECDRNQQHDAHDPNHVDTDRPRLGGHYDRRGDGADHECEAEQQPAKDSFDVCAQVEHNVLVCTEKTLR